MSTRKASDGDEPPIERREQLVAPMQAGEKPPERWRIGTEHEKLVFATSDHHAPSYEEKGGIHALLIGLTKFGWTPVYEGENIIALSGPDGAVSPLDLAGREIGAVHRLCAGPVRTPRARRRPPAASTDG